MATTYKYTERISDAGSSAYVKYNISPAYSAGLKPGDTITISGQISGFYFAINKISFCIHASTGHLTSVSYDLITISKSIAKNATSTFTMTQVVDLNGIKVRADSKNSYFPRYAYFVIENTNSGDFAYSDNAYDRNDAKGYICSRTTLQNPSITSYNFSDSFRTYKTINGSQIPKTIYGGYIQGKSNLSLRVYPSCNAYYDVTLTLSGGSIQSPLVYNVAHNTYDYNGTYHYEEYKNISVDFYGEITYVIKVSYLYNDSGTYEDAIETGTFYVYQYNNPTIDTFSVERYIEVLSDQGYIYEQNDEGTQLWVTMDGNVTSIVGTVEDGQGNVAYNAWSSDISYKTNTSSETTITNAISGTDGSIIHLLEDRSIILGNTFVATDDWYITIVLSDSIVEPITVSCKVNKAGAIFNIEKYGVAVGMRSTGTEGNEKFECAYPASFSGNASFGGNVAVGAGKLLKVVDVALTISFASGDNRGSASRTAAQVQTAIGTGWTALCCIPTKTGSYLWYFTQTEIDSGALEVSMARRTAATASGTVNPHVGIICIRTSL